MWLCWMILSLGVMLSFMLRDEDAFFRDYAESHKKLSELGFTPTPTGAKAFVKDGTILAQSAVGVAVAAAVVILGYFYEVRKKMK
ncbi:L-ascorbate peroxidase 3 [Orobanche gracilis]